MEVAFNFYFLGRGGKLRWNILSAKKAGKVKVTVGRDASNLIGEGERLTGVKGNNSQAKDSRMWGGGLGLRNENGVGGGAGFTEDSGNWLPRSH